MTKLAVQTHTLRNLDVDVTTKLDRIAEAGYEGVQFTPGLEDTEPSELADLLDDRGLSVAGCHIKQAQFEEDFSGELQRYNELGTDDLVISSYGQHGFESEATVKDAAADVNDTAQQFAEHGVELHYHNHTYEFVELDGQTGFDIFALGTADHLSLEIDTGLAYRGDVDPAALITQYADRVDLIHLTDTIPGDNATAHIDLGKGEVDIPACIEATVDAGATWLIYENGRTDEPFESIEAAADVMQQHL